MLFQSIYSLLMATPFFSKFGQLAVDEVDHALQFAHLSLPLVTTLSKPIRGYFGGLIRGLKSSPAVGFVKISLVLDLFSDFIGDVVTSTIGQLAILSPGHI